MKLTSAATFSGSTYGGLRHWQVKKAGPKSQTSDVRFGSKADISQHPFDVCYSPKANIEVFGQLERVLPSYQRP
jgi:hypothetical protein